MRINSFQPHFGENQNDKRIREQMIRDLRDGKSPTLYYQDRSRMEDIVRRSGGRGLVEDGMFSKMDYSGSTRQHTTNLTKEQCEALLDKLTQ